jgi:hypothetical protein
LIGGLFLFLTLKNKPLEEIIISIQQADKVWIAVTGVFLVFTFIFRAWRWRVLIQNTGYNPRKRDVFYAVMMGYFVNSFTPKLGEIARCTVLSRDSDAPVSRSLGTVVSERVYDVLIMLFGLLVIAFIEMQRLGTIFSDAYYNTKSLIIKNSILSVVLFIVLILLFGISRGYLKRLQIFKKFQNFFKDFLQTVRLTFRIKKYRIFVLLTILIWISLIFMNYSALKALPDTSGFNLYFAVVVLFVGAMGWALPTPGGIGTTHFFILQLFIAFNLSENAGVAYGVLSNGLTFVFTIGFGLLALLVRESVRFASK